MIRFSVFLFLFLPIFLLPPELGAQPIQVKGSVTYLSSGNVYVRFASTKDIQAGDTLFIDSKGIPAPCLKVVNKSSVSCVCTTIGSCRPAVGDSLMAIIVKATELKPPPVPVVSQDSNMMSKPMPSGAGTAADTSAVNKTLASQVKVQQIRGYISAGTYSAYDLSNGKAGYSREVGRIGLNVDHIMNSDFSFEAYGNYQRFQRSGYEGPGKESSLNLYSAALVYSPGNSLSLRLGRKILPEISSIGPVDGLHIRTQRKGILAGAILGFKPDIYDYSFNPDRFQYGAYTGLQINKKGLQVVGTLGAIEQRYLGAVDRRYLYLQQSTTLKSKLSFFTSIEMDLYEHFDSTDAKNTLNLSSFYASANYRLTRKLTLFASYDTRKQIIYFESYNSEIERLLADQEARQGLRLRLNYRLLKNTSIGLGYSNRYQVGKGFSSENLQASIYQSKIPWLGGSVSYYYNQNRSLYVLSRISSVQYSRGLRKESMSIGAFYRIINYKYAMNDIAMSPFHNAGLEFSTHLKFGVDLSLYGELNIHESPEEIRFNARLTKRFNYTSK